MDEYAFTCLDGWHRERGNPRVVFARILYEFVEGETTWIANVLPCIACTLNYLHRTVVTDVRRSSL